MIHAIALTAWLAAAPVPAATPGRPAIPKYVPRAGDFTVVCTLYSGEPPGPVARTDIPVTYDPRFVIGARVEKVTHGVSPWKVGESVRFVIHSPSLMLGGVSFDGRPHALTFSPFRPKTEDDRIWFEPETEYLLRWIEKTPTAAVGAR